MKPEHLSSYSVRVHPWRGQGPSGGPWLIRCYAHGEHVHSAEGGVTLAAGLREVERAIERFEKAKEVDGV